MCKYRDEGGTDQETTFKNKKINIETGIRNNSFHYLKQSEVKK